MHLVEAILAESQCDGGLTDGRIAEQDYLGLDLPSGAPTAPTTLTPGATGSPAACPVRRAHSDAVVASVGILGGG